MRDVVRVMICATILGGCAASGVQVTDQQAQEFQVGKSTYADVVAALGEPTSMTLSSGRGRVAVYSYSAVSSRPQNFIPFIGRLVAGYEKKSSAVVFVFDSRRNPDGHELKAKQHQHRRKSCGRPSARRAKSLAGAVGAAMPRSSVGWAERSEAHTNQIKMRGRQRGLGACRALAHPCNSAIDYCRAVPKGMPCCGRPSAAGLLVIGSSPP